MVPVTRWLVLGLLGGLAAASCSTYGDAPECCGPGGSDMGPGGATSLAGASGLDSGGSVDSGGAAQGGQRSAPQGGEGGLGCLGCAGEGIGGSGAGGQAGQAGEPSAGSGGQQPCQPCGTPGPVNLGTAQGFVILAKTGISTIPISAITGDIGVSPAAASYLTGFALIADASNVFATSSQVTGKVYAATYAPPTPSNLTIAVLDMQAAFSDAAGRAADVTELGAGNIGGMTLTGGVYAWSTGLLVPTDVTLAGSATDVWIFQVAKKLTISNGTRVHLSGGASADRIFWQASEGISVGTTAHVEGVLLGQTAITLATGATLNGRILAQTAVTLDGSNVVQP